MPSTSHPFTKQDLARIDADLASLANAKKLIDRATAAGIDVSAIGNDCDMCKDTLEGIKREFFTVKASP